VIYLKDVSPSLLSLCLLLLLTDLILSQVVEETLEKGFNLYLILEYGDGGVIMAMRKEESPSEPPQFYAPSCGGGLYSERDTCRYFRSALLPLFSVS
jgi:hypothetical protein